MNMPSEPGWVSHYLFEQPWYLAAVFGGVAIVFAVVAWRRGKRWPWGVALVALFLGGLVVWGASAVQTEREALMDRTRLLVQRMSPIDAERLGELIRVNAVLIGPDGAVWVQPGLLWAELKKIDGQYGQLGHRITQLQASADGSGVGVVQMDVRTDVNGRPMLTRWRMRWVRGSHPPHPQERVGLGNQRVGAYELAELQWLEHPLGMEPRNGVWR